MELGRIFNSIQEIFAAILQVHKLHKLGSQLKNSNLFEFRMHKSSGNLSRNFEFPDDEIKQIVHKGNKEKPTIYKMVKLVRNRQMNRRKFLVSSIKLSSLSVFPFLFSNCENSNYVVNVDEEKCTCHVVCTCDYELQNKSSVFKSEWTDGVCTCNTVCVCDTVCPGDYPNGGCSYDVPCACDHFDPCVLK